MSFCSGLLLQPVGLKQRIGCPVQLLEGPGLAFGGLLNLLTTDIPAQLVQVGLLLKHGMQICKGQEG